MYPAMKALLTWMTIRWRSIVSLHSRYWCKNTIIIIIIIITINSIKICWVERRVAEKSGAGERHSLTHSWPSLNASSAPKSICPWPIAVTWPKHWICQKLKSKHGTKIEGLWIKIFFNLEFKLEHQPDPSSLKIQIK